MASPPRLVMTHMPPAMASLIVDRSDAVEAICVGGRYFAMASLVPDGEGTYTLEADELSSYRGGPFDDQVRPWTETTKVFLELPDDYYAGYDHAGAGRYEFDCLYTSEEVDEFEARGVAGYDARN